MPVGIPIQAVPSQTLTVNLNGSQYIIGIRYTNGCMSLSVSKDGTQLIQNMRAVPATPVLPAKYLEDGNGNFMFLTANNLLPLYTQFNLTQSLLYFTPEELAAFRQPPVAASPQVPTVTANFFNPVGGLPLRFAPQGYVAG